MGKIIKEEGNNFIVSDSNIDIDFNSIYQGIEARFEEAFAKNNTNEPIKQNDDIKEDLLQEDSSPFLSLTLLSTKNEKLEIAGLLKSIKETKKIKIVCNLIPEIALEAIKFFQEENNLAVQEFYITYNSLKINYSTKCTVKAIDIINFSAGIATCKIIFSKLDTN